MAELETDRLKKLKAERAAVEARIRAEQLRLNKQERKADTRRKIVAGAAVLAWAKRDNNFSAMLMTELKSALNQNRDRVLFGLPPLPKVEKAPRP
jgi:ribonuclease HII